MLCEGKENCMMMKTTNKYIGKHMKMLCRRSKRAFKQFRKEHPKFKILGCSRQIYSTYGTLCVEYIDTETNQCYANPYIFF